MKTLDQALNEARLMIPIVLYKSMREQNVKLSIDEAGAFGFFSAVDQDLNIIAGSKERVAKMTTEVLRAVSPELMECATEQLDEMFAQDSSGMLRIVVLNVSTGEFARTRISTLGFPTA